MNPNPHKVPLTTQKQLYARNPYLLSYLSQNDVTSSDKILSQFVMGNTPSLSLVQLRGLFVYVLQIAVLGTDHDITKEKEKDTSSTFVNIRIVLASSVKLFINRYNSTLLSESSLDHNNVKCLRCMMYLLTSIFDVYATSIDSTESVESLEAFLKFSTMLLHDIANGANAVGIKEKDRERMTLYCRTLGIIGSSFLLGRHSKDLSIQGKKIGFCQDIVQALIGTTTTTSTATTTTAASNKASGSSNNNRGGGPEAGGLLKGYFQAVQATALAPGTAALKRKNSFNIQKKTFSIGLGLSTPTTKDALDAKNIRQVMVPTAMLSTLRRVLLAAASAGVARRSGNRSSGGGGMLTHETLLAAITSGHHPLCQHAVSIVTRSLATKKIQVDADSGIQPDGDSSLIALTAKLKSRLLCIDSGTSNSGAPADDLNSMLTATYILRAIAVLVRVREEELGQMDVEKAIVDLLTCVAQLLKTCSNLKVLIEAATVFIGEHQQDNPHFLSNWHLVRLTEQPLLTHHKELFITGFLTPPLLQHMNSLFESSDMKDKYLQPVLLRFISRFGRFLIVRPSDRALAEPPYLIGEVLLHPLWEILRVQTLNCMGAADGGAFETEEIFGQAIKTDLEYTEIKGQGSPQLLEQLITCMLWIAPDHRYCEKDHKELWSSLSKIILRGLCVLSSPSSSHSAATSATHTYAGSYAVICNLFERVKASTVQERNNGESRHIVCYCKEYVDLLLIAVEQHVHSTLTCYSAGVRAIAMMEQTWHWLSLFFSPVNRANVQIQSSNILTNLSVPSLKNDCETHSCEALLASILRVTNIREVSLRRSNLDTQHKKVLRKLQLSSTWAIANYASSFVLFPLRDPKNGNVKESIQETVIDRLENLAAYECDINIQTVAIQGLVNVSDAVSAMSTGARNLPLLASPDNKNINQSSFNTYKNNFNSQEVEALALRVLLVLTRLWGHHMGGNSELLGNIVPMVDLILSALPSFGNASRAGELNILKCFIRKMVVGRGSIPRDAVQLSILKLLRVLLKMSSSVNVNEMTDALLIGDELVDEACSADLPYIRLIYDPWVTDTSRDSLAGKAATKSPVKPAKPSPHSNQPLVDFDSWPLSMGTASSVSSSSSSVDSSSGANIFAVDQFSPQNKDGVISVSSSPITQDVFLNPLGIFDTMPPTTTTSSVMSPASSFSDPKPAVLKISPLDTLWAISPAPAQPAVVDQPAPPTTDAFDENLSAAFSASSSSAVNNIKANSKEVDDFAPSVAGSGSPENAYYASQYTTPQPMHYPAPYPLQYPVQYPVVQYPMQYPPISQQPPHPNLNPQYYPNHPMNPNPSYGALPNNSYQYPTYLPPSERIDKDNPFK